MDCKNLLKDSKSYYENNDYYEMFSVVEDSKNEVINYLDKISKEKIILDAGCGTGKFLNVLESNSAKYIGLDLSQYQLEKAKKKSVKNSSEFICSNLSDIPLENDSIDLIVSAWVLGTITDLEERNKCLHELTRVLKPKGEIILIENSENSEFEELRGRTKDSRTRDYNNWIVSNGFTEEKDIDTYFMFDSVFKAKECFEAIYGKQVASKIKDKKIEHKITIYIYKGCN